MFFVQASLELFLDVNLNQITVFHRLIIQAYKVKIKWLIFVHYIKTY